MYWAWCVTWSEAQRKKPVRRSEEGVQRAQDRRGSGSRRAAGRSAIRMRGAEPGLEGRPQVRRVHVGAAHEDGDGEADDQARGGLRDAEALKQPVGEVREEDERSRQRQEEQVETLAVDPGGPGTRRSRWPSRTSKPPESRNPCNPTKPRGPGAPAPAGSKDTKIDKFHARDRAASRRSAAGARPHGGHHGPRLPADAPADRRRRARHDGVHLLGGDHPRATRGSSASWCSPRRSGRSRSRSTARTPSAWRPRPTSSRSSRPTSATSTWAARPTRS